jgi:diaminohydroxyphosphoribosylaminopyrimidine deaminase/5-amino-6-(5-phosphoribosylamino)uracil reductase
MLDNRDIKFMQLALKLAERGAGNVEPNPAVGCVIVKGNTIIGKSWHKKFGSPHAEINAIEDCKKRGTNPEGATIYVTLEPCCHYGKTGPCTDTIIAAKPAKVVAATIDPSKHNNGKGIEQLKKAGIDVQTGVCKDEAELLNAPFMKFATTGKCWVILKWAQSINGKMTFTSGQRWISCEKSRKDAHRLRRRVQGILVGINTVIADDPLLTPRPSKGKNPLRIVLDSFLKTPSDCQLLTTAKKFPTLIVTSRQAIKSKSRKAKEIVDKGAELRAVPAKQGKLDLKFLLKNLAKRGIAQLLVEGGAKVIISFLKERLADEICVYIAPKILGAQGNASISKSMAELTEAVGLHYVDIKRFGDDVRINGLLKTVD